MEPQQVIEKLENSLTHFLISEMCKSDPTKRTSPEMYKYKGLGITYDPQQMSHEKTIFIRIGVLEAEYKISSGEKYSGSLAPEEERLISLWMHRDDTHSKLRTIFQKKQEKKELNIIPFDLENYFI